MAYYFGDALKEIKKIQGKDGKHLDLTTLPEFARSYETEGGEQTEIIAGRDLGAMVSLLTVAIQQLTEQIEHIQARLDALEQPRTEIQ